MMTCRRLALAPVLLVLVAIVIACSTTPKPDPDNGVSPAGYRQAITKARDNMAGVLAKLSTIRDADLATAPPAAPAHSKGWWDAQLGLLSDTATLLSDTLAGATK